MKRWIILMAVLLLTVSSLGCLSNTEEIDGSLKTEETSTSSELEEVEGSAMAAETPTQTESGEGQINLYDRSEITTAEEAWEELMKGNERYVAGKSAQKDISSRRDEVASGQHPFVTVITCSDSRVSPEILFDQGLGDIFVIRTAGHVVDPIDLGSIEYGVEHLHTPLLVVLGHQSCGAVTAAVENVAEGNIGVILDEIKPAVDTAKDTGKEGKELIEEAVNENVKLVIQNTLVESPVVKELVEQGELKIIGAKYFLDSGEVELLEEVEEIE